MPKHLSSFGSANISPSLPNVVASNPNPPFPANFGFNTYKAAMAAGESKLKKHMNKNRKSRKNYKKVSIKPLQLQCKHPKLPHFFSKDDLFKNSIRSRTHSAYLQRAQKFVDWLNSSHQVNSAIPIWDEFIQMKDLKFIDNTIASFLVCKFNQRANSGGTLAGDISAIMFVMQQNGCSISGDLLPQSNRVVAGANTVIRKYINPNLGEGTRALLNPMLEQMLDLCQNQIQRLRLLVPCRFGLRAEHVCSNLTGKDGIHRYLKRSYIEFGYSKNNNPIWVSIKTGKDKNHELLTQLERCVYCSCGLDKYSCVVHELHAYLHGSVQLPADDCLLRNDDNSPLTYDPFNNFAKKMALMLGLNPRFYTTHCYRKGAMTELSLGGLGLLQIVDFGKWGNISAMKTYVKLSNPDLSRFYASEEYKRFRRNQGNPGMKTIVDISVLEFLQALKQKKRKETSVVRKRTKLNKINEINKPISSKSIDSPSKSSTSNTTNVSISPNNLEFVSASKSDSDTNSIDSIDNINKLNSKIKGKKFRGLKINTALILPDSFKGRLTRNQLHLDSKSVLAKKSKFIYDPSKAGTKKYPSESVNPGKIPIDDISVDSDVASSSAGASTLTNGSM